MESNKTPPSTNSLQSKLFKTVNLKAFLKNNIDLLETPTFSEFITQKCVDLGEVPERIIKRADIDRTYGHQLFQGIRQPSRDKVIQLAIGFGLNVDETQNMLLIARKSPLYVKIKRDAAILFCINRKMDIFETQELLQEINVPILKRGEVNE